MILRAQTVSFIAASLWVCSNRATAQQLPSKYQSAQEKEGEKCPQNIAQLRKGVVLGREGTYQGDTCPLDTRAPPRKPLPHPTLPRRPAPNSTCRVSATLQGCETPTSQSQPARLESISSNFSPAESQSPGPQGSSCPGGMDDADRPHVGKQRPASQLRWFCMWPSSYLWFAHFKRLRNKEELSQRQDVSHEA